MVFPPNPHAEPDFPQSKPPKSSPLKHPPVSQFNSPYYPPAPQKALLKPTFHPPSSYKPLNLSRPTPGTKTTSQPPRLKNNPETSIPTPPLHHDPTTSSPLSFPPNHSHLPHNNKSPLTTTVAPASGMHVERVGVGEEDKGGKMT